ncbi:hypothetical protein QBC47DRAFT_363320 [Echria macrotheca]|uniref:C2H2-type domain-containing protein n=1 Tax=Echria macrotheca TaxID=438768 RepID=A0AAJ0B6G6_9PEZI|nr:hypothetical protein QBC47DRAFT_363320 [Echria macrotheca]
MTQKSVEEEEEDEENEENEESDEELGWWDRTTAEIASIASDELHETRPNRWTGTAAEWTAATREERRAWAGIEEERRGDLAAHLFNAFALGAAATGRRKRKRGVWEGPEEEEDEGEGEGGGDETPNHKRRKWAPDRNWTAWPLPPREVPPGGQQKWSSTNLEEEVSAVMLRFATRRFRKEQQRHKAMKKEAVDSIETPMNLSSPSHIDTDTDSESGSESSPAPETARDTNNEKEKKEEEEEDGSTTPVPATDDDLSYSLLRPVARRILDRLDATLTVLHNTRVAALGSVSEESSEAEKEGGEKEKERGRGKPGRPRNVSSSGRDLPSSKLLPREGETHGEMMVRLARRQKRRMPEHLGRTAQTEDEVWERRSRSRSRSRKPAPTDENIARMGLRDWRDVVGAAALAGFAPKVLARAAQRCATLFGEGMSLVELPEAKWDAEGAARMTTTVYTPGVVGLESDDESDDEGAAVEREMELRRAVSRQSSLRLTSFSPGDEEEEREEEEDAGGGEGSSAKKQRSASATPASAGRAGGGERTRWEYFCPHKSCRRAVTPFTRKSNLGRHLKDVHGEEKPAVSVTPELRGGGAAKKDDELPPEFNEMVGGVHRDLFLQPIKPQPGWRGKDVKMVRTRKSVGKYRSRQPAAAVVTRSRRQRLQRESSSDS